MSEAAQAAAVVVAATDPLAQTPAVVAPATPAAPAVTGTPEWLQERLERAERVAQEKLLKSFGVSSADEVKMLLQSARERREAERSDADKLKELRERAAIADTYAKQLVDKNAALAAYAEASLSALTPGQRAAVVAIAGDDPSVQLKAVETLRPTWIQPAGAVATAATETKVAPATTAPVVAAPPPASGTSPNHLAVYESLRTNPVRAADYYLRHANEIDAQRKK